MKLVKITLSEIKQLPNDRNNITKAIFSGDSFFFLLNLSGKGDSTDDTPIFLEAPHISETVLSEEDPDQEQRLARMDIETHEEEAAQSQASDTSIRQRHGPWLRL